MAEHSHPLLPGVFKRPAGASVAVCALVSFILVAFPVAPAMAGANSDNGAGSAKNSDTVVKHKGRGERAAKHAGGTTPCYQAFCNTSSHMSEASAVIHVPHGVDCPADTSSNQSAVISKFKASHPECSGTEGAAKAKASDDTNELKIKSKKLHGGAKQGANSKLIKNGSR